MAQTLSMYRYVMRRDLKARLQYYYIGGPVVYDSFRALTQHGFPSDYNYWQVLCKLVRFEFYHPTLLREVYVHGYAIPAKFFDITTLP